MVEGMEEFLAEARRRTYAAQGDEASRRALMPGARQFEHREGHFLYRDTYFGVACFVGQETVYVGQPPHG